MTPATRRTGWVFDERYLWHDTGTGAGPLPTSVSPWIEPMEHVESPPAKRRLVNLVTVSGLLDQLHPVRAVPATEAQVEAVHTRSLRERLLAAALSGRGPSPRAVRMAA